MVGGDETLIFSIFKMLEIAISEIKLMHEIDSSYEFSTKDYIFIQRTYYHFIKPL